MAKAKTPPTPLPFRILKASFPILEKVARPLANYIVVRLFFTPFRFKPRPEEVQTQKTGSPFSMTVNGNRVQAFLWGDSGPLVVLVHGWSGRGMQLRKFVQPLLSMGFQVASFDAPGHGESEGKDSSLLELRDTLIEVERTIGPISIGIGHSLGGAALIYAAKEGMQFQQIITLSTPSIPEKIIEEFLRRINGSPKMGQAIDDYVFKRTGEHFDYYAASQNVSHIPTIPILSFHDHNDREAGIEHAYAMRDNHANLTLVETRELGHNRILKDEKVLKQSLKFIQESNKLEVAG